MRYLYTYDAIPPNLIQHYSSSLVTYESFTTLIASKLYMTYCTFIFDIVRIDEYQVHIHRALI